MLTKRIIPCLDIDNGRVVKGVSFKNIRDAGDPQELAAFYDRDGADELVFLDITASADGRDTMIDVVKRVSEEVFIPMTVGGGIRSVANIRRMLEAGADKVSLNTAAVLDPSLVAQASAYFGSQCIVVAIDIKNMVAGQLSNIPVMDTNLAIDDDTRWEVYTHGGRNAAGIDALKWAKYVADLGAGELLVTSMDADGQKNGYDLDLMYEIGEVVMIPLIASGGAGTLEHLYDVASVGADAVLAASIFHYGEYTIPQAKDYLQARGLPIRPIL